MAFFCIECGAPLDDDDPDIDLCFECENEETCASCGCPTHSASGYCDECQEFLDLNDEDLSELFDEDDEQFLRGI
jgi:hypothetical protein